MRFVPRTPNSVPVVLSDPNRLGVRETKRASSRFDDLITGGKPATDFEFEFKAYKLPEVKEALNQLFHGKCAYCESRYAGTQPMDVEHWRPKGLVNKDGQPVMKPGYYWLAAEWDNLLPSCIDCNRAREHHVPGENTVRLLGKANQFPIEDERKRWADRNTPNNENPLLLHPCIDIPDQHLSFQSNGVVQPKQLANGEISRKGQESIDVYALNRNELVWDRAEVIRQIERYKSTIRILATLLDTATADADDPARLTIEDLVSHEMAGLRRFAEPGQPFSMMASQLIMDFIREFAG